MLGALKLALALVFILCAFTGYNAPAEKNRYGTIVELGKIKSAFIAPIGVTVWLPPGYAHSGMRYAVVYMQDGQNLFDRSSTPANSFFGAKWGADTIAARLMADDTVRPAIVVGIANLGRDRARQYTPMGVYNRLPQSIRQELDREFGGKPFSDDYLRFLTQVLKPFIDRTYRTHPGRDSTFVMGSSMGGLTALYALTEYPEIFGGAACLSTHWPLILPAADGLPSHNGRPLFAEEVVRAFTSYLQNKLPMADRHRVWFDHGTKSLDAFYGPYQHNIDRIMVSHGWRPGIDFESRVYPGATHNERAWRVRLAAPLQFLLEINEQRRG